MPDSFQPAARDDSGVDLSGTSLLDDIRHHAAATPDKPAVLPAGREPLSYGALWREVQAIALALARTGLSRSDTVASALPDGAELLCSCLGAAGVAAFAPLNPGLPKADLQYLLSDLGAAALIVRNAGNSPAAGAARALGVRVFEADSLRAGAEKGGPPVTPPRVECSEPVLLLHTSATTGRPKLVCLTNANFRAMAVNSARALGLTASDRFLSVMPLFHLQGLQSALQQLMVGGSVICAASDAGRFPDWLAEYAPTWYTAGPTLHRAVLAALRERGNVPNRGSLRFVRSIGAALPPALLSELEQALRVPVLEGYGPCGQALQTSPSEAVEHIRFLTRLGREKFARLFSYAFLPSGAPGSGRQGAAGAREKSARAYAPKTYRGKKIYAFLAAGEPHSARVLEDTRLGWRDFAAGGFESCAVPGTHMRMFQEPHVFQAARRLSKLLAEVRA